MENIDTIKELKKYVDFMNEYDLEQLEIEKDGKRVTLKKHPKMGVISAFPASFPAHPPRGAHAESGSAGSGSAASGPETKFTEIKSPMVGTFYRAPAPDAQPYVEKGQTVKKGDVLCIIEAMKLMNEIKAEIPGVVRDILIENGEPVEFGQVMFLVEPA